MTKAPLDIARKYAEKQAYGDLRFDLIQAAGSRGGYDYFVIGSSQLRGRKTGKPRVVKVSTETLRLAPVERLDEIMWAVGNAFKRDDK